MEFSLFIIISFLASFLGSICGIGGGVLMKPAMDAAGVLGVEAISFLSGCTVLVMSLVSVFLNREDHGLMAGRGHALATGAAAGGIMGKKLFEGLSVLLSSESVLGAVQSAALIVITAGTLVYTVCRRRIKTHKIGSNAVSATIGWMLGLISSFLGIGGGPVNLVMLYYFFSMETKEAVRSSLYIILISQAASLLTAVLAGRIPEVPFLLVAVMSLGGFSGGMAGSRLQRRLTPDKVSALFTWIMLVIIGINMYNFFRFTDLFS